MAIDVCKVAFIRGVEDGPKKETLVGDFAEVHARLVVFLLAAPENAGFPL